MRRGAASDDLSCGRCGRASCAGFPRRLGLRDRPRDHAGGRHMAKPTGIRTPLDAKRARLRAKGLTDAEISQILINRQTAGSQPTGGAPPMQGGNMSGVLGNVSAAVSYARGAIFGIRGDVRNLFDRTAPPLERVMSGGFLAFKLAVVAVISFAILSGVAAAHHQPDRDCRPGSKIESRSRTWQSRSITLRCGS